MVSAGMDREDWQLQEAGGLRNQDFTKGKLKEKLKMGEECIYIDAIFEDSTSVFSSSKRRLFCLKNFNRAFCFTLVARIMPHATF